jgi:excisionase family DNA binding protein
MLTVAQTAALLGISRMTVTRMADAGVLPCVVIARGNQKRIRRFPRRLIEDLALGRGCNTCVQDYCAGWLARSLGGKEQQQRPAH